MRESKGAVRSTRVKPGSWVWIKPCCCPELGLILDSGQISARWAVVWRAVLQVVMPDWLMTRTLAGPSSSTCWFPTWSPKPEAEAEAWSWSWSLPWYKTELRCRADGSNCLHLPALWGFIFLFCLSLHSTVAQSNAAFFSGMACTESTIRSVWGSHHVDLHGVSVKVTDSGFAERQMKMCCVS